ncbi:MAG: hypothetical protein NZ730_05770 [Porticoccaceae bacterium]|nr:hypothetical protein [Porticoccaceae bacterium]
MGNNLFVLTEKDLVKLSSMMLLAAIFFGLSGLVMMIILQWITRQSYAKDNVDKHGISQVSASRLGGCGCHALHLWVVGHRRIQWAFHRRAAGWLDNGDCLRGSGFSRGST